MLRTARHGEGYQYFLRKHGSETNGKYIKKKEMKVAQSLAQIEVGDTHRGGFRRDVDSVPLREFFTPRREHCPPRLHTSEH